MVISGLAYEHNEQQTVPLQHYHQGSSIRSAANRIDPQKSPRFSMKSPPQQETFGLMKEWRPVIVDSIVVKAFNTLAVRQQDFFPTGLEDEPQEPEERNKTESSHRSQARKLLLTSEGVKRWLTVYERRLQERAYYPRQLRQFSYRQMIREQVYRAARFLRDEEPYEPFLYSG